MVSSMQFVRHCVVWAIVWPLSLGVGFGHFVGCVHFGDFRGFRQSVDFVRATAGGSENGKGNTPRKETDPALEIMSSISVRFLTFGNNVR